MIDYFDYENVVNILEDYFKEVLSPEDVSQAFYLSAKLLLLMKANQMPYKDKRFLEVLRGTANALEIMIEKANENK